MPPGGYALLWRRWTLQMSSERSFQATVAALPDTERRHKRRAKVAQPVRVRPSEPRDNDFDEVRVTLNVCRDGLYFATQRDSYFKGLRLFITFPYQDHPGAINLEYIGKVVRVDRLADGRHGVAIHLLMSFNLKSQDTRGQIRYSDL